MKKYFGIFIILLYGATVVIGQTDTVDVADLSIKIKAKNYYELNYGFESGDQIIFSFKEINNNEIESIIIYEEPSMSNIEG